MADDRMWRSKQAMLRLPPHEVAYLPPDPGPYRPGIGLIGCGNVSRHHLAAYGRAHYNIVALCDLDEGQARKRGAEFFPNAIAHGRYADLLGRSDVEVVDVATPLEGRAAIVEAALNAGKHVLSQTPLSASLDEAERLIALADARGVRLAVNQNGRWAPHFGYILASIAAGSLGDVTATQFAAHWDHGGAGREPRGDGARMLLLDLGIHWFDMIACIMGERDARRVYASVAGGSPARMLAHAIVEYDGAQAALCLDGTAPYGAFDITYVAGTRATIRSSGQSPNEQWVNVYMKEGYSCPPVEGEWFTTGFQGTMAELLCAVAEGREPTHSARSHVRGLSLSLAALASAAEGAPKRPGEARSTVGPA